MARILITSGPTRQYLDPVRYLSNASSGKMGVALATAAIQMDHEVVVISGPVSVEYPEQATVIQVVSTDEMLAAAVEQFKTCDGVIAAAAPTDYRPVQVADQKLKKTGSEISISLEETEDILATLGRMKTASQWSVGFALETEDAQTRALAKLKKKNCDLVVLNGAAAIDADNSQIMMIDKAGDIIMDAEGSKIDLGVKILYTINATLLAT